MRDQDHFQRLGLPRRFDLTAEEIERQYLLHSREVHPDLHQQAGSLEQRGSVELSSALNEAYQILREPFRRAEYLLLLAGGASASEQKEMPQTFLMEMLDLREQIEEIKSSSDDGQQLENLEMEIESRRDSLLKQIGKRFGNLTAKENPLDERKQIRQLLNATKYIQNLLRDLRD